MRILIATGIYPPQIGGPATYSKLLYDELPKRGIDVKIVNFGDFIDKPKFIRHFLFFLSLLKNANDVDLIYAQDPVSVGLPTLFASQVLRKKFILKIVGDYAWEQSVQRFGVKDTLDEFSKHYQKYSWQVKVLKKIEKYVADWADAIVTPSEYLKTIICNWGLNPKKIKVIYNGFNLNFSKKTKPVLRKQYGISGKVFISVGRLVPWKGFKEVIRMLNRVKKDVPDANLIVVGDGPNEGELKELVNSLNLTNSVKFVGRLAQSELFDYVKASDIFVLNTEYEGFSHQIIETMAIGTPIITTNVGGNSEAITHRKTGLLVSYNNIDELVEASLEIIREATFAKGLARNAKIKVKQFTDENMLESITNFLNQQKQ